MAADDIIKTIVTDDVAKNNIGEWKDPNLGSRADRPASIEDAMILIYQILSINSPDIDFTPAYPDYLVDSTLQQTVEDAPQMNDETIAWSVIRMEPGSTSAQKFGRRKELRPRFREDNIPNNRELAEGVLVPETQIVTYGQTFDSIIQFDCFAKTNFSAERLVTNFMKTMTVHADTLIKYGISRWYFERRLRDSFLLQFRNGIIARSVQYYMKSEEVTFEEVSRLKSIRIALEQARDQGTLYPDWATRVMETARVQVKPVATSS
jgi:hypothetical protein